MSDLVERLRKTAEMVMPHYPMDICTQAADRIEALEAALNYVADMTYYSAGAEWHFKLGYDPQEVLAALAPEQEK